MLFVQQDTPPCTLQVFSLDFIELRLFLLILRLYVMPILVDHQILQLHIKLTAAWKSSLVNAYASWCKELVCETEHESAVFATLK